MPPAAIGHTRIKAKTNDFNESHQNKSTKSRIPSMCGKADLDDCQRLSSKRQIELGEEELDPNDGYSLSSPSSEVWCNQAPATLSTSLWIQNHPPRQPRPAHEPHHARVWHVHVRLVDIRAREYSVHLFNNRHRILPTLE